MKIKTNHSDKIFQALNYQVRFIGGCVRNSILKIESDDIDLATPILPNQVIRLLEDHNIRAIPTGLEHGTVTAVIDNEIFEITTLRKDIDCNGRHAKIEYTDNWQEDSNRRDFTINAISCDIDGKLYDYHNGIDDLEKGIVRFVGDASQRCQEDYLRILRYFRFCAYYNKGEFNPEALNACNSQARGLEQLSGERIAKEMYKLIVADSPLKSLQTMTSCNIDKYIFASKTNLARFEQMLNQEEEIDPLLRLASLLNNINDIDFIKDRWKISNKDIKELTLLILNKPDIENYKKQRRHLGNDIFKKIILLALAGDEDNKEKYNELISIAKTDIPTFPVNGNDLLATGLKAGPGIGRALEEGAIWWENNDYEPSKDEILSYLKL